MTEIRKIGKKSYLQRGFSALLADPFAKFAIFLLSALCLIAILGPFVTTQTFYETHLSTKNSPPSLINWFGSDELGRDVFVRVCWGMRISLFVGITAALIDVAIGVIYGAIAALSGRALQESMMRVLDVLHSLPQLLITILLMVIFGSGIFSLILALTITGWINMARITRGEILKIKQYAFVQIAQMQGASSYWILRKHLVPNCMSTIITTLTFTIPSAIFAETFLSFLGLGVQAPYASLGTMASDGFYAINYYPWRLFFPAGFISLTMLSFNILGDALKEAFDPKEQP